MTDAAADPTPALLADPSDPSDAAPSAPAERLGHRFAPPEVWDQARGDYLAGLSARQVCARWGVSEGALRRRAAREGWRRSDQAWGAPERLDPLDRGPALEAEVDGDVEAIEPRRLAGLADTRMMRAVLRGDAAEALRWRRVRDAMREEQADFDAFVAREEEWEFQHRPPVPPLPPKAGREDVADVEDLDPFF